VKSGAGSPGLSVVVTVSNLAAPALGRDTWYARSPGRLPYAHIARTLGT
jgi:hypothetical protein